MNSSLNRMALPGHFGPHPQAYHQYVSNFLSNAIAGIQDSNTRREVFEDALARLAAECGRPGTYCNSLLTK